MTQMTQWGARQSVLVLTDPFGADLATAAARELEEADGWDRRWYVARAASGAIETVTAAEFAAARTDGSTDVPYSRVEILDPAGLRQLPACGELMRLLSGTDFARRVSDVVGQRVEAASEVNAAAYRKGDYLRAHRDDFDGWVTSCVLYLSVAPWQDSDGGLLGIRADEGPRASTPPTHNTIGMIPLRSDLRHWVEPVTGESFVRRSLNIHFRRVP